jgi:hypothetical protein
MCICGFGFAQIEDETHPFTITSKSYNASCKMCNRYFYGLVMPFPDTEVNFNYNDQKGHFLSIDLRLVILYAIIFP